MVGYTYSNGCHRLASRVRDLDGEGAVPRAVQVRVGHTTDAEGHQGSLDHGIELAFNIGNLAHVQCEDA